MLKWGPKKESLINQIEEPIELIATDWPVDFY